MLSGYEWLMTKARLTGGQGGAAIVAGIIGHLLFASGWLGLGITLLGGLIVTIIGGTVAGLGSDLDGGEVFGRATDVFRGILFVLIIAAAVLIVLALQLLSGGKFEVPPGFDPSAAITAGSAPAPSSADEDSIAQFSGRVADDVQDGWTDLFKSSGATSRRARIVRY